jgi:hypothetical protein
MGQMGHWGQWAYEALMSTNEDSMPESDRRDSGDGPPPRLMHPSENIL